MTDGTELDDAALSGLAGELAGHRDSLRAEIRAHGADPESDDISFVDDAGFADRGHSSEERGHVIAVVRALRSNLTDVEHALAKIDAGTYGICERCGRPIPRERLEAIPWAALGIDCKQQGGAG